MATELVQQQSMRQEQTMTHHQIQALEMLFAPVMELSSIISSELEKNPVLEMESEKYERLEIEEVNNEDVSKVTDKDEWVEQILHLDKQNGFRGGGSYVSREDEEERRHFLDSLTTSKSMHQSLAEQVSFLGLDEKLRECCETVISGLDDDGYLSSHPADLAMVTGMSLELINNSIAVIQNLEPAGVAARDLRERLMLQLERLGMEETLAYRAVSEYLDDIANNRLPKVAKSLNVTMTELQAGLKDIQKLDPHLKDDRPVMPHNYIQEEVEIIEEKGELRVKVLNSHLPNLKISNYYRKLLEDPTTTKEVKDYVKSKINGGVFLINSLMQRQNTITKITESILRKQEKFFREGINFLKPLTMAQVAEASGVHETTVSRAVAGKYLRCRFGLFPLRFFFSPGYESADGKIVSNMAVKEAIKDLVAKEEPKKPFSDSQLADKLKEMGLSVARRTVAKYRESIGILPSNLRRAY